MVDLLQECNAIECATGAGDGDEASISISIAIDLNADTEIGG